MTNHSLSYRTTLVGLKRLDYHDPDHTASGYRTTLVGLKP